MDRSTSGQSVCVYFVLSAGVINSRPDKIRLTTVGTLLRRY